MSRAYENAGFCCDTSFATARTGDDTVQTAVRNADVDTLLAEVAFAPGRRELRRVLADALLENGDPRGELMVAQLDGDRLRAAAALPAVVGLIRQRAPQARRLVFQHGLLAQLEVPLASVRALDPLLFREEPLARVVAQLPAEPGAIAELARSAAPVVRAARGVELLGRVAVAAWPAAAELVTTAAPRVLMLDVGADAQVAGSLAPWPSVDTLRLTVGDAHLAALVLEKCASLRRLSLRAAGAASVWLKQVLALPKLGVLDLRGQPLSDEERRALVAWERARAGRVVRHEHFSLENPDPLDDVFGDSGLSWSAEPEPRRRLAFVGGAGTTFSNAHDRVLQLHHHDSPAWQEELDAPVTALGAARGEVLVGREDGALERYDVETKSPHELIRLPGVVRTIDARGDDVAVSFDGGWWWRSHGSIQQGNEQLAALVLVEGGVARAEGTVVRVETDGGDQLVTFGEPVHALASDGGAVWIVAGHDVWRLERGVLEHVDFRSGGRPAVSARGGVVAWTSSSQSVELRFRDGKRASVHYPREYSDGLGGTLRVADVAVGDDGVVAVALEEGGVNLLLELGAALKADEFPREPARRWVFIYNGSILVAG